MVLLSIFDSHSFVESWSHYFFYRFYIFQYKNIFPVSSILHLPSIKTKNFANLLFDKDDFQLCAEWHFFATSHGKSPCDGIGGCVKRLLRLASLRKTNRGHILNVNDLFQFCIEKISGIIFFPCDS